MCSFHHGRLVGLFHSTAGRHFQLSDGFSCSKISRAQYLLWQVVLPKLLSIKRAPLSAACISGRELDIIYWDCELLAGWICVVTSTFGLGLFLSPPLINANILYENRNMSKNGLPCTSARQQDLPQRWWHFTAKRMTVMSRITAVKYKMTAM